MFVESGGDESESTETNLLGHRAKDPTLEIQFQVHFKKAKSFPDLDAVLFLELIRLLDIRQPNGESVIVEIDGRDNKGKEIKHVDFFRQ